MTAPAIRRKLVIIGDGGCGKTSLLNVFAMGEFPEIYEPTIFENYVAEIRLDGKPVQLALWDTAGQEEYERLRPFSYSKSHVILIAFSLDTPDSLENVTVKWIEEVRALCGPKIPVILVGCKKDLRDAASPHEQGQFVQKHQAEAIAEQIDARCYMECSALKNDNVDHIFEVATRAAMLVRSSPSTTGHGHGHSAGGGGSSGGGGGGSGSAGGLGLSVTGIAGHVSNSSRRGGTGARAGSGGGGVGGGVSEKKARRKSNGSDRRKGSESSGCGTCCVVS